MHDQTPAHPSQAEEERATVEADLHEKGQDAPAASGRHGGAAHTARTGDAPTAQERTRATSEAEGDREPAM